jgi:hypothetical protein
LDNWKEVKSSCAMAKDQLLGLSDGDEEDDDGHARVEGDVAAADSPVTERYLLY